MRCERLNSGDDGSDGCGGPNDALTGAGAAGGAVGVGGSARALLGLCGESAIDVPGVTVGISEVGDAGAFAVAGALTAMAVIPEEGALAASVFGEIGTIPWSVCVTGTITTPGPVGIVGAGAKGTVGALGDADAVGAACGIGAEAMNLSQKEKSFFMQFAFFSASFSASNACLALAHCCISDVSPGERSEQGLHLM